MIHSPNFVACHQPLLGIGIGIPVSRSATCFTKSWIALDDATLENGCLTFGEGTNLGPVYAHEAPPQEPFNLQLPAAILERQPMVPAPVLRGGVSFHHGNTFHASGPNHSTRWRRACALHFVSNHVEFANPALPYDHALKLRVT